jgi:two-component system, NarL family, nitrate/nitrite response regulator NarL
MNQTTSIPVRLLLADDHPLMIVILRQLLGCYSDLIVVGEATHGTEVCSLTATLRPDVLLLDLILPGPSPQEIAVCVSACSPQTKMIVFSGCEDERYVQDMVALGAAGYILKSECGTVIVQAIRTVIGGGCWFSQPVLQKLTQHCSSTMLPIPLARLTAREQTVLKQMASGCDNRQIAASLNICQRTVKFHVNNILNKLNLDSRAQAIAWAWQHELIKPSE